MALKELKHPYICGYQEFFVTWDKEVSQNSRLFFRTRAHARGHVFILGGGHVRVHRNGVLQDGRLGSRFEAAPRQERVHRGSCELSRELANL